MLTTRSEQIARFNERVTTPSAYLPVPNMDGMVSDLEYLFSVQIPEVKMGHGVLVLTEGNHSHYDATPFALDPAIAELATPSEHMYGFHEYVAIDALREMPRRTFIYESSLCLWRTEENRVVAHITGYAYGLSEDYVESVRYLSVETPEVTYVGMAKEDDARIKISRGKILTRAIGIEHEWIERRQQ